MKKLLLISLFTIYYLLSAGSALAQTVDIIWQGEGYTAPFYQGRALWSIQSQVTFFAIPQGLGNPSSLNYKWIRNGTVLGTSSGLGKNSLSFNSTIFPKPVTVEVEIVGNEEELLAEASATLTPLTQALAVYEDNPLYGFMFHRDVLGSFFMENEEVTFTGFPFFFATESRNSSALNYRWRTNAGEAESGSSVTYRIPEESSGTSQVSLDVSHKDSFMQNAERAFLVQFGNENSN